MQAAILDRAGVLGVEEVPRPAVGAHSLLVEVSLCAVTGGDLVRAGEGSPHEPQIPGAEFVGTVREVGPGASAFAPGDRVATVLTASSVPASGGMANLAAVDESALVKIDPGISDPVAARFATFALAWNAVRESGIRPGDTVCIVGAGGLGLSVLDLVQAMHPAALYVVEPLVARRQRAIEMGATRAFGRDDDVLAYLLENLEAGGADIVFDCAGRPSTLQFAATLARGGGGQVIMAAWHDGPDSIVPNAVIKEADIHASLPLPGVIEGVLAAIATHAGRLQELAPRVVGLSELPGMVGSIGAETNTDLSVLVDPSA